MTKIAISPNPNGTGTFTIAAPDSNTNRTLTLPDAAGVVATQEYIPTALNASGSAPIYAARAWVNFNGTGTVAIRASGNVSSITDNGAGDYTVNFTTAMPDANYAIATQNPVAGDNTKGGVGLSGGYNTAAGLKTTTQCRVRTGATTGLTFDDFQEVHVAFFR